jgi:hypothetical protein
MASDSLNEGSAEGASAEPSFNAAQPKTPWQPYRWFNSTRARSYALTHLLRKGNAKDADEIDIASFLQTDGLHESEILAFLSNIDLSSSEFGKQIGVPDRTIRYWQKAGLRGSDVFGLYRIAQFMDDVGRELAKDDRAAAGYATRSGCLRELYQGISQYAYDAIRATRKLQAKNREQFLEIEAALCSFAFTMPPGFSSSKWTTVLDGSAYSTFECTVSFACNDKTYEEQVRLTNLQADEVRPWLELSAFDAIAEALPELRRRARVML